MFKILCALIFTLKILQVHVIVLQQKQNVGGLRKIFLFSLKRKEKKKVGDLRFFFFFFGGDRTEGGLGTKKGFGTLLVF